MWASLRISRKFSITASCHRMRKNSGIGRQIKALGDVPEAMQDDPEGFGDMETDFANVHKTHKGYELELKQKQDQIRQFVVKSKYFPSQKLPNFLTYAEKEQIRFLHNKDAEQWSVDVLAESFPANCETIRKVIKSHWKPLSVKNIQTHDKGVSKNWLLFQKGEFNNQLPKELQDHLKNCMHRQKLDQAYVLPTKTTNVPSSREFYSIVAAGANPAEPSIKSIDTPKQDIAKLNAHDEGEDSYLLDKVRNKKYIRFQELKELQPKSDLELTVCNTDTNRTGSTDDLSLSFSHKFALNEVVIGEADKKRYEISSVKDRIYIPRKLRRSGATYRIDDCYYDDDGEFLYRVPGMTAGPSKT